MNDKLPSRMRLAHLTQHHTRMTSYVFCHELSRLDELCLSPDAKIRTDLEFALEPGSGQPFVIIETKAALSLKCQRCLMPMEHNISQRNRLIIVEDEAQAEKIPLSQDIVVCDGGYIDLKNMVEDDILLALPDILVHSDVGKCDQQMAQYTQPDKTHSKNPFAVLRNS